MKKGVLVAIGCGIVAIFVAAVALGVIAIQKSGGFAILVNGFRGEEQQRVEAVFRYPEEANEDEILAVLELRANEMGLMHTKLESTQRGLITMRFDRISSGDYSEILDGLTVGGKLEFQDYEGNVLLNNSDVAKAYSKFGKLSENGVGEHYIELQFTPRGEQKFSEATGRISQLPEGNNYLAIYADETVISAPMVREKITTETAIITGNFTQETAQALAKTINSGALPCELEIVSFDDWDI